jgi:hypothetical protein
MVMEARLHLMAEMRKKELGECREILNVKC